MKFRIFFCKDRIVFEVGYISFFGRKVHDVISVTLQFAPSYKASRTQEKSVKTFISRPPQTEIDQFTKRCGYYIRAREMDKVQTALHVKFYICFPKANQDRMFSFTTSLILYFTSSFVRIIFALKMSVFLA